MDVLSTDDKQTLLGTARAAIEYGLEHNQPPPLRLDDYHEPLRRRRATFVTLKLGGRLRGCMGGLTPRQPLIVDVSEHAFMAAFSDPRFTPVRRDEAATVAISLSLLSMRTAIDFANESELVEQLRPHVDGLIIARNERRATFLPSVWASLSEPREFLAQLKRKARMPLDAEDYRAWRYTAEAIEQSQ